MNTQRNSHSIDTAPWIVRLASLVSGGGTTAQSLAMKAQAGELWDIRTVVFIASKDDIGAIEKAQKLGIPVEIVNPKDPIDILRVITKHKVQIVFQNGWLPKTPEEVIIYLEEKWIIALNQHPGDLRRDRNDFGWNEKGKWMYGTRVTASRVLYLAALGSEGEDVFTSSSIHRLTPDVDGGELVGAQRLIFSRDMCKFRAAFFRDVDFNTVEKRIQYISAVLDGTAPDAVEKKPILTNFIWFIQGELLKLEHLNVAHTVQAIIENWGKQLPVHPDYESVLVPGENVEILNWAKSTAVQLYPKG